MDQNTSEDEDLVPIEHFRLVSGGECKKAGVQCWSVDQLIAECNAPQQMENFRSCNAMCMTLPSNDKYVFSLSLHHIPALDQEIIPEEMRRDFAKFGRPLSGAAGILAQSKGRVWFMVDGQKKFSVRMVPTGLLVYSERL